MATDPVLGYRLDMMDGFDSLKLGLFAADLDKQTQARALNIFQEILTKCSNNAPPRWVAEVGKDQILTKNDPASRQARIA